ncbi:MAG: SDR family oxidoreductase [Proteobacteria bacterium]|nr:SDR family oxidoreductase [Pseudomonadota bacterium]
MATEIQVPMLPLKGMRAFVTGGAQGIGAGICIGLARAGAAVAVVDIQTGKTQDIVDQIVAGGGMAIPISADICSEDDCRRAIDDAVAGLGGLDILVNCAAPGRNRNMLGKLSDVDWDTHQQIVLNASAILADAACDHLAASGHGAIVNISSVTSHSIAVDQCSWPYHVSKAGLDQFTRWLAVRFGGRGIRVNAVAPGLVDRDSGHKLTDNPQHRAVVEAIVPLGRAGHADDIAQAVVFLCSRQAAYITGQILTVDGGLGVAEVFGASLRAFKAGVEASS